MILEACTASFEEAVKAMQSGAHRIELCSRLDLDGLTPQPDVIRKVCAALAIPVMVMIRPRAGNFVYSAGEIEQMEHEISTARKAGAAGVVLGVLTDGHRVDLKNTRRLAEFAHPLDVTFHKAIDYLPDPVDGVRQLLKIRGINRILTSGGNSTAREGVQVIRQMLEVAGNRVTLVVAGKVTRECVAEIARLTGAHEFHGRRIVGDL